VFLSKKETRREDIVTILVALQRQNFVMANSLMNLVDRWPTPDTLRSILPDVGIIDSHQ